MNDETKPEGTLTVDDSDDHSGKIPVENLHFNILAVVTEAKKRFKAQTGKDAKFIYAPEAMCWMIDNSIRSKARAAGQKIPAHAAVVQVLGMDMVVVLGTCITLTAEPLHENTGNTPPVINAPHPSTVQ